MRKGTRAIVTCHTLYNIKPKVFSGVLPSSIPPQPPPRRTRSWCACLRILSVHAFDPMLILLPHVFNVILLGNNNTRKRESELEPGLG